MFTLALIFQEHAYSFYSGWGNGFNTAITLLWVSELSPAKSRGRLVSIEGNLIAFGVVVAYFFNIGMSYLPPSNPAEWRVPIAFQGAFIITQIVLVYFLPESPRWLTKRTYTFNDQRGHYD
jgi:MFS family permease